MQHSFLVFDRKTEFWKFLHIQLNLTPQEHYPILGSLAIKSLQIDPPLPDSMWLSRFVSASVPEAMGPLYGL